MLVGLVYGSGWYVLDIHKSFDKRYLKTYHPQQSQLFSFKAIFWGLWSNSLLRSYIFGNFGCDTSLWNSPQKAIISDREWWTEELRRICVVKKCHKIAYHCTSLLYLWYYINHLVMPYCHTVWSYNTSIYIYRTLISYHTIYKMITPSIPRFTILLYQMSLYSRKHVGQP